MKKILVTGGTTFVSKYVAEYFLQHDYDVYVLNRNNKPQLEGVNLIEADRHDLGYKLAGLHFDVVADVTAYDEEDVADLLAALDTYDRYILISSSAVYPENGIQPFMENSELAVNNFWRKYGTDKIAAEKYLLANSSHAYILRPPYLYGPMNNVYREAFVFECAEKDRHFYIPQDGNMKLQFFHVRDLCIFMKKIIDINPENHIFNVGNKETVSVKKWVEMCYQCLGKIPKFIEVHEDIIERKYFSFYNYEYYLNVDKQSELLIETTDLQTGLEESYDWYMKNKNEVVKKPYIDFIDENLIKLTRR